MSSLYQPLLRLTELLLVSTIFLAFS